jgi:hypothetical protein
VIDVQAVCRHNGVQQLRLRCLRPEREAVGFADGTATVAS